MRALPDARSSGAVYATTPFLCPTTLPLVILGGFGNAVSSFSSRTQVEATFVEASPCSGVSKRPSELKTPLPASIR